MVHMCDVDVIEGSSYVQFSFREQFENEIEEG